MTTSHVDIDAYRKQQMARYRRYIRNGNACRDLAMKAYSENERRRLMAQADDWFARAYHEVA